LLALTLAGSAPAFDVPKYDPWYYQSNEQGYLFMVPDKAQHFYGSALLNEINRRLILRGDDAAASLFTLTLGVMYEVYQDSQGIGFSKRDVVADVLGVAASQLSSKRVVLWLDYSTFEKVIMFKVTVRLSR
jgi:uncharacterized protein YfiM (DUF2279 family)